MLPGGLHMALCPQWIIQEYFKFDLRPRINVFLFILSIAWASLTELQEWEENRIGGVPSYKVGMFKLA